MKLKRNCLTILLLVILTMSFCYFHIKRVHASLFSDGFESGNTDAWDLKVGTVNVNGVHVHSGAYSATITASETSQDHYLQQNQSETLLSLSAWYYIDMVHIDNETDPWRASLPIMEINTNGACGLVLTITQDSNSYYWKTKYYDQAWSDLLSENAPANSTWYQLEIQWRHSGSQSYYQLWVNGSLIWEDDYTDNYSTETSDARIGSRNYLGQNNFTLTAYFDDCVIDSHKYYFNFNFYDLDSEDVELYVDWALWNSTDNIDYTEGEISLYSGTYYLKTQMYGHLINTTTLDTDTYGNSTIDINLNMKRHQSCSNGFIASNDTISSMTVHAETPQLLNFTIERGNLTFDGVDDYIDFGVRDSLDLTSALSLEAFFQIPTEGLDDYGFLLARNIKVVGAGSQYGIEISHKTYGHTITPHVENEGWTFPRVYASVGVPVHVVFTFESPTWKLYVDADLKKSRTVANTINSHDWRFLVGAMCDNGGQQYPFKGIIDEIRIYDRVLELDEVEYNKNHKTPLSDGLVLWLPMNEGSGDTVYDKSGNANNGTLKPNYPINAPEWSNPVQISVGVPKNASHIEKDGINMTDWVYVSSPSHIHFNITSFSNFAFHFPMATGPVGPFGPHDHRVKVNVRLNGEWLKGCNVTVEGGPANRTEWGLTDVFGSVKFKLKTGPYDIVASYEQHRKVKPVYVSTHMTIGIDLTEEDIISPDLLPEPLEDLLAWVKLPELDLTTETILVFILPLIVLVAYALKKVTEGPKRKWKYSYLK